MVKLSRKNKIALAVVVSVAIILMITVPYVSAQTVASNACSNVKTLNAKGNIYQKINNDTIMFYPANLTLTLQPTYINGTVRHFEVTGGTLVADGVTYTFASGSGGVLTHRHDVLLQAQGTDANGQTVTLKLAAHYSYNFLASRVTVKIIAKLQTQDGNYTLLMHSTTPA